jgi:hypothetical protein
MFLIDGWMQMPGPSKRWWADWVKVRSNFQAGADASTHRGRGRTRAGPSSSRRANDDRIGRRDADGGVVLRTSGREERHQRLEGAAWIENEGCRQRLPRQDASE